MATRLTVHSSQLSVPSSGQQGSATQEETVETEAKFWASRRAFREIERCEEFAGWQLAARGTGRLRDTYGDPPDDRLLRSGCTLRLREIDGAPAAELTFKGPASAPPAGGGSHSRLEV